MDEVRTQILKGLQKAMQAESHGQHFYLMAARSTEDEKGREVFNMLAEEEEVHLQVIQMHFRAMKEKGKMDPEAKLGSPQALAGTSPIFSVGIRSRLKDAHFEITALSVGIELELSSIRFYRDQAQATDLEEVKSFYQQLIDWEQGHYEALAAQQTELKEEYWSLNGFAPF